MELFKLVGKLVIEGADVAGKEIDKVTDGAKLSETKIGKASQAVSKVVKGAMLAGGAAMAGFAVTSFKAGSEFQAAMSEVAAISGATGDDLTLLSDTAKKFGSTTQFSASEAAQALKYMSLAGWDAKTSTGALGGVLDLAAAAGMGLAAASDMVTDYMSAFGWEASRSAEFADRLAYAQANSNTTVEALGDAFKNCAANMNAAGQDVETVTSMLEAMANQGFKGAEAGTALTAMMRDITQKMKDGKIAIGDTNVEVMDANGNYRDLTDILRDVEAATNGMGDAQRSSALMETFTADSIKGLNMVLNEGVDTVAGYEEALRNSAGTAGNMAGTMNGNVSGSVKGLMSALESLQIAFFDCFSPEIQGGIDAVSGVVRSLAEKVPVLQQKMEGVAGAIKKIDFAGVANTLQRWSPLIFGIVGAFVAFNTVMGAYNAIQTVGQAIQAAKIAMNLSETATLGALAAAEWAAYAPMLLIAAAIGALITVGILLWKNWDTIKETALDVWNTVCNVVQVGVMLIGSIMSAAFQIITLPWQMIWQNVKQYIIPVWNTIKNTVKNAITSVASVISSKVSAIKSAISTGFNAAKNTVSSVVTAIKNAVSTGFNAVKSTVTTVWNSIKTAITTPIDAAKSKVKAAVDAIKGFFANMNIKLPNIKLPHFKVSGKLSIAPPEVPHLSIDWYKKAMDNPVMFTEPTLFSLNPMTGTAKGAGEAGDEVMIGKNTMMNMIKAAVSAENDVLEQRLQRIIDLLSQFFPEALAAMNQQMVLDTGVLVAQTAPKMDVELGRIAARKGRGR